MLGEQYKTLYEDYYNDGVEKKRELTAVGTLDHIKQLVGSRTFDSIVDVGAGQGALIGLMHAEGRAKSYVGLEISSSGLERISARKLDGVSAVQFDGYKSELPDKAFELALSVHVMEHVEHERLYLKELARISREAIIEVPLELTANPDKIMATMAPYGHINFYRRDSFESLLRTSGFKINGVVVNTVRKDLDVYISGPVKGAVKNTIRRLALSLNEKAASRKFVYLCTVHVTCP